MMLFQRWPCFVTCWVRCNVWVWRSTCTVESSSQSHQGTAEQLHLDTNNTEDRGVFGPSDWTALLSPDLSSFDNLSSDTKGLQEPYVKFRDFYKSFIKTLPLHHHLILFCYSGELICVEDIGKLVTYSVTLALLPEWCHTKNQKLFSVRVLLLHVYTSKVL